MINLKLINFESIKIDGVDRLDHPDYCDAYIYYAEWTDGVELTEEELEQLNEAVPETINQLACEQAFSE